MTSGTEAEEKEKKRRKYKGSKVKVWFFVCNPSLPQNLIKEKLSITVFEEQSSFGKELRLKSQT